MQLSIQHGTPGGATHYSVVTHPGWMGDTDILHNPMVTVGTLHAPARGTVLAAILGSFWRLEPGVPGAG